MMQPAMSVQKCTLAALRQLNSADHVSGRSGVTRTRAGTYASAQRHPSFQGCHLEEDIMGFGRGALLWLLGVPLPIILLLALFWHH